MNASTATICQPAPLVAIEWRDLVALTPAERAWELTLSLPWLVASLCSYANGWWWFGLPCSFYFFLTGLRQSHNAQHYSLGLPRIVQDGVLFALSLLMFSSMHAVQATHLHHHRHCLGPDDAEGSTARLPWWRALLVGPLFPLRLHLAAWRQAKLAKRAWITAELAGIAGIFIVVVGFTNSVALHWHFGAMIVGECFTGFFAVWTVHHGCGADEVGRTQRGQWLNRLSYSMFFHAEHHLFPAVPTAHLPILAKRLDAVTLTFARRQVFGLETDQTKERPAIFQPQP
jgi:fatty acid desaturase